MQSISPQIVILGTGGTIAGLAPAEGGSGSGPGAGSGEYKAAQLGIAQLVAALPALAEMPLVLEQVAQIDSKDMSFAVWRELALRVAHHLADPAVGGIVITHGTDTLEESAYLLQRLLAPPKPVVLTAAMRPANAPKSDGPQNLRDAIEVARVHDARGVVAVLAGTVHGAFDVRKAHTQWLDAFSSGDAGPIALVENGHLRRVRDWPDGAALGVDVLPHDDDAWPWVEIVTSAAATSGAAVRALMHAGVKGLVIAGTGNGSIHADLEQALVQAEAAGIGVVISTRCGHGVVTDRTDALFPSAGALSPPQARVELMLRLLVHGRPEAK